MKKNEFRRPANLPKSMSIRLNAQEMIALEDWYFEKFKKESGSPSHMLLEYTRHALQSSVFGVQLTREEITTLRDRYYTKNGETPESRERMVSDFLKEAIEDISI